MNIKNITALSLILVTNIFNIHAMENWYFDAKPSNNNNDNNTTTASSTTQPQSYEVIWGSQKHRALLQENIRTIEKERDNAWNIYLNTKEYKRIEEGRKLPYWPQKYPFVRQAQEYAYATQEFQKCCKLDERLGLLRQDLQTINQELQTINNK
jgi:hypothetical protein